MDWQSIDHKILASLPESQLSKYWLVDNEQKSKYNLTRGQHGSSSFTNSIVLTFIPTDLEIHLTKAGSQSQ